MTQQQQSPPLAIALSQALADAKPGHRAQILHLLTTATEAEKAAAWKWLRPHECRAIWEIFREHHAKTKSAVASRDKALSAHPERRSQCDSRPRPLIL